jgi:adenylylsulfate kinase
VKGLAIWITGLPGSGKSSVADELHRRHPDFVVLRMDEMRKVVTPHPSFSADEREIVYRSIVFFALKLTELGHDVIIDATGNLRKWRELARKTLRGYVEVYLKCPLDLCMERERERVERHHAPGDIYAKGSKGWPVPGVAAPYEEPLHAEVVIDVGTASVETAARIIEEAVSKLK